MNAPRLTGSRCQCTACGDYFGSVRGFDRHRVGEVGTPSRRCLTSDELAAAGWVRNAQGFWLQPDPRRAVEAHLGASEGQPVSPLPPPTAGPPESGSQQV